MNDGAFMAILSIVVLFGVVVLHQVDEGSPPTFDLPHCLGLAWKPHCFPHSVGFISQSHMVKEPVVFGKGGQFNNKILGRQ